MANVGPSDHTPRDRGQGRTSPGNTGHERPDHAGRDPRPRSRARTDDPLLREIADTVRSKRGAERFLGREVRLQEGGEVLTLQGVVDFSGSSFGRPKTSILFDVSSETRPAGLLLKIGREVGELLAYQGLKERPAVQTLPSGVTRSLTPELKEWRTLGEEGRELRPVMALEKVSGLPLGDIFTLPGRTEHYAKAFGLLGLTVRGLRELHTAGVRYAGDSRTDVLIQNPEEDTLRVTFVSLAGAHFSPQEAKRASGMQGFAWHHRRQHLEPFGLQVARVADQLAEQKRWDPEAVRALSRMKHLQGGFVAELFTYDDFVRFFDRAAELATEGDLQGLGRLKLTSGGKPYTGSGVRVSER